MRKGALIPSCVLPTGSCFLFLQLCSSALLMWLSDLWENQNQHTHTHRTGPGSTGRNSSHPHPRRSCWRPGLLPPMRHGAPPAASEDELDTAGPSTEAPPLLQTSGQVSQHTFRPPVGYSRFDSFFSQKLMEPLGKNARLPWQREGK